MLNGGNIDGFDGAAEAAVFSVATTSVPLSSLLLGGLLLLIGP